MRPEKVGDFLSRGVFGKSLIGCQIVIASPFFLDGFDNFRSKFIVRPRDVLSGLAIFSVGNLGLKDLIRLVLNVLVAGNLVDRDAIGRSSRIFSKRHRDRGHDAAEAQGCGEACCHCQACDVLAHAHLLFLRFPFGSHSIGHHLSVS